MKEKMRDCYVEVLTKEQIYDYRSGIGIGWQL